MRPRAGRRANLLFIRAGDVGLVASSDGGALIAGIQVGLDSTSDVPSGDLGQLAFPFHRPQPNAWARAQGALLDKILRAAYGSGALQKYVDEQYAELGLMTGSAKVTDTETKIEDSGITIGVRVTLTGVCFTPIDVWYRQKLELSVFNGEIRVVRTQSTDVDLGDEIACAIVTLGLAVATLGVALGWVLANVIIVEVSTHAPLPITVDAVLGLLHPVPGTEAVADVEVLQAACFDGYLETLGGLTLNPDNDSTFVYAQFFQQDLVGHRTPIAGASVTLYDRDWPPVPGDDVQPPPNTRQVSHQWKLDITTETRYEHPTGDQVLGRSTTDTDGRVRFSIAPDQLHSSSGRVAVIVTMKRTDQPQAEPVTNVTFHDVPETQPDLCFAVGLPGQHTWTTSPIVNVHTKHVGTAAEPLEYTAGGPESSSG